MPEVRAGDASISWEADGPESAPALLLSNSLGTTRQLWDRQIATLRTQFRVIRYDTRGHGRSGAPVRDYSIDELGRDAIAVLDAAGAARAHVCGVSLGGVTAMWLGIHAPDRVGALVLANTAAKIGTREAWDQRIEHVRGNGLADLVAPMMTRWFSDAFQRDAPDIVTSFRSMVASCNPAGYIGCCAALRDADLRSDLPRIDAPSLVIVGADDPATPPSDGKVIRDGIPGARLITLDARHLSNVECASAFSAHVCAFLQG